MKNSSIGIIFGFILLIIANLTLSEEPHRHVWHECEYGKCIMCETTEQQVTYNGKHWETRQSKLYFKP